MTLLLFDFGTGEIFLIVLAIFLVFGPGKIPELARNLGKFINEIKRASEDVKDEINREANRIEREEKLNKYKESLKNKPADEEKVTDKEQEKTNSETDKQEKVNTEETISSKINQDDINSEKDESPKEKKNTDSQDIQEEKINKFEEEQENAPSQQDEEGIKIKPAEGAVRK